MVLVAATTAAARFSLGAVLALVPLLLFKFFGEATAHAAALALNLAAYCSLLALGSYVTVMRDVRSMTISGHIHVIRGYERLAVWQTAGSFALLPASVGLFWLWNRDVFLSVDVVTFAAASLLGVLAQATTYWLNIACGLRYAQDRFVRVGVAVTMTRVGALMVIALAAVMGAPAQVALLSGSGALLLFSSGLYYLIRSGESPSAQAVPGLDRYSPVHLLRGSLVYVYWSLLALAVMSFPVTGIAAASAGLLLPATYAFFVVNAAQVLVAALITPHSNRLQDRIGQYDALYAYLRFTARSTLLVTLTGLAVVWAGAPVWPVLIGPSAASAFLPMVSVLIIAFGFRSLTLAPTQAAIALKKERLVMISPVIEALLAVLGVALCSFWGKGEWILWVVVSSVLVRVGVAFVVEMPRIVEAWRATAQTAKHTAGEQGAI